MNDPNPYRPPSDNRALLGNRRVGLLMIVAMLVLLACAIALTLALVSQSRPTPQVDAVSSPT